MLRRFAPHIVIVALVLASISVFVVQKITSDSYIDPQAARSCAELLSLYSAPYRPTLSRALSTTMSMCDYSVQFYDAEDALVRRVEAPDGPCVRLHEALDRLKGRHGLTLLDRIRKREPALRCARSVEDTTCENARDTDESVRSRRCRPRWPSNSPITVGSEARQDQYSAGRNGRAVQGPCGPRQ
jgi:hypothetical protein